VPTVVALTKCDKLKPMRRAERVRLLRRSPELPAGRTIATSAQAGLGIPELWAAIDEARGGPQRPQPMPEPEPEPEPDRGA
jgi:GTP-binding protein EngB required for normal cell division